ncbi:MAG TPA: MGMT family protein [Candidatus Saccharimonadia bacterium]
MNSFTDRVYDIVAQIPAGKVATYGDVARMAGTPGASRAVGMAMSHNRNTERVPCHRVVGSDGKMHGYAFGGEVTKRELLASEGVAMTGDRVDLRQSRWQPE